MTSSQKQVKKQLEVLYFTYRSFVKQHNGGRNSILVNTMTSMAQLTKLGATSAPPYSADQKVRLVRRRRVLSFVRTVMYCTQRVVHSAQSFRFGVSGVCGCPSSVVYGSFWPSLLTLFCRCCHQSSSSTHYCHHSSSSLIVITHRRHSLTTTITCAVHNATSSY